MPLIDPKNIRDKCHIYFTNKYALYTTILMIINMLYFKSLNYYLLYKFLLPFSLIFIIALLLPFVHLLINTFYGIYLYKIIPFIGSITPLMFLSCHSGYNRYVFFFYSSATSIIFYYDRYLNCFHKTRFILMRTSREIYKIFYYAFPTYVLSFIVFTLYLFFLLFTELNINVSIYKPKFIVYMFAVGIHIYWTAYIIIYSYSFFIISCLNYRILSEINQTKYSIYKLSYNFYNKNIKNIIYCAFKAKHRHAHMMSTPLFILLHILSYLNIFINNLMYIYDSRNQWPIVFIALINQCGCKFIKDNSFGHQIDYKIKEVMVHILFLRYFLVSSMVVLFIEVVYYVDNNFSLWFLFNNIRFLIFFSSLILFCNALMYYSYEHVYRNFILFCCCDRNSMIKYDALFVEEMEKEILVDVRLDTHRLNGNLL